jgi:hypothetical protein
MDVCCGIEGDVCWMWLFPRLTGSVERQLERKERKDSMRVREEYRSQSLRNVFWLNMSDARRVINACLIQISGSCDASTQSFHGQGLEG